MIELLIRVSGFLFLLILILSLIVLPALGYVLEPTLKDYDPSVKLPRINSSPRKFKITVGISLIHHISVITLPILLFLNFNLYNIILGIVWMFFRIGEGLILIVNEWNYWGLLDIASKYLVTSDEGKKLLDNLYSGIIQRKRNRFKLGMFFWAIGTFAYSIFFVTYNLIPLFIGWLGIVASISVGLFNGLKLVKPKIKGLELIAVIGASAIPFETILGIWLLFYV